MNYTDWYAQHVDADLAARASAHATLVKTSVAPANHIRPANLDTPAECPSEDPFDRIMISALLKKEAEVAREPIIPRESRR
jgi:hypothetical protein